MAASAGSGPELSRWADDFAARPVPVLRATVRALERMALREDSIKARDVASVVLRDPMLTLAVLRHLRTHHSRRMLEDITTVEHAVMMLGVRRFFATFGALPVAEEALAAAGPALAGLMEVVCRARAAAIYAGTLAALRADPAPDQVAAAALLHDLAEMLLWCFAPERAGAIAASLAARPGLRSAVAQEQALGFRLGRLQLELARRWDLPELILSLMDDAHADRPRVRNVTLSVALARHAARGWRDPALPSDLEGIAALHGATPAEAEAQVFNWTLRVIVDRAWYGAERARAPLPPLPRPPAPRSEGATPAGEGAPAFELARSWLARLARGQPATGQPRGGLVRDARHEQLAAVAALMDGITNGLDFASGLFMVPGTGGAPWQVLYAAGEGGGQAQEYVRSDPAAAASVQRCLATCSPVAHAGAAGERPRGLFAWPVVHGGEARAVALALDPAMEASLSPDRFDRFSELGAAFDAAMKGLDATLCWTEPDPCLHPR